MITMSSTDLVLLGQELRRFSRTAYPLAVRKTINASAWDTRARAQRNIKDSMINRNTYTVRSVRVEQARGNNIAAMVARTGSIAPYMASQEFGGVRARPTIPTTYAAGEALSARVRTRLPRRANKLKNISLRGGRATNPAKVRQASTSNRKYVYLKLQQRRGIFKVIGKGNRLKVRMVHDMSHNRVTIPRNPWLYPAAEQTRAGVPQRFATTMRRECQRLGLLGY